MFVVNLENPAIRDTSWFFHDKNFPRAEEEIPPSGQFIGGVVYTWP